MNRPTKMKPHGQIRRSQIITTFGPGALLDLPKHSVLVGGLEHWSKAGRQEVREPRLVDKLKCILQLSDLQLFAPPPESDDPTAPSTGITVFQFPEWFVTQDVKGNTQSLFGRSRLLLPRNALERGCFVDEERRRVPVVPVRFVRACRRGHIDDIDWFAFVHGGKTSCRRPLWLDERGTTGDLAEVWVRCDCGVSRAMSQASLLELGALGHCNGARPWLGRFSKEPCGEPSRLLVRSASNAYFPQTMSVISLPEGDQSLTAAVDGLWTQGILQGIDTLDQFKQLVSLVPMLSEALAGFQDEAVVEEILRRKGHGVLIPPKSVKQAEIETLFTVKEEIGEDVPEGDFYARALPLSRNQPSWMDVIERIVLVHRLREVIAQVGFTRFESISPDVQGELEMGVQRAALALDTSWLPAVENRGEGIFIAFRKERIETWLKRSEVEARGKQLLQGFESWKRDHTGSHRQFPGLSYILLHSLSHLLITAVSLECGYPVSSIRERVYANEAGFGILLYTGSPDAEGTLGGLVETGRRLAQHLAQALELGRLCSNDPVCSQHLATDPNERRYLLGAACHGCLLISETCCEQRNDYLDRSLLVPTVASLGAEFFGGRR